MTLSSEEEDISKLIRKLSVGLENIHNDYPELKIQSWVSEKTDLRIMLSTTTTAASQSVEERLSWADLPTDILNSILWIANEKMDRGFFNTERNLLSECQHVCKSWSRAAQAMLYRKVDLNARNIHSFIQVITNGTSAARPACLLVHHIHFDQTFSRVDFLEYIEPIKILFSVCSRLRHVTCAKESQHLILSCLGAAHSGNLPHLQSICCPTASSAHEDTSMSLNSLFPFKSSLARIYIRKANTWSLSQQILYKNLMAYLGDYTGLRKLVVQVTESLSLAEFDSIVNSCQQLEEISISHLSFIHDTHVDVLTQRLVYHKNVQKLHVVDLSLHDVSILEYLTKKFVHLQTFKTQLPVSHTQYLMAEWEALMHSIKHLPNYEVVTKAWHFDEILKAYVGHIYNKTSSSSSSSSSSSGRVKKKVVEIHFNSLNYDPNTPTVIYAFNEFIRNANTEIMRFRVGGHTAIQKYLELLTDTIRQASPHDVVVTGLNYFGPYYKRLKEKDLHHFRVKDYHPFFFNTVDAILRACENIPDLQLTLGDLILRDTSTSTKEEEYPKMKRLKQLTLDHSVLHRMALPLLSRRVDTVDTLRLNMCDLTGQQEQQQQQQQQHKQQQQQQQLHHGLFKNTTPQAMSRGLGHGARGDPEDGGNQTAKSLCIDLPFTKVNTLILILPTYYSKDDPYKYVELLHGLSVQNGMYLLKIETEEDGTFYRCFKRFSQKVEMNDLLPLFCNQLLDKEVPFVISVKCKRLERLILSNGEAELFTVDKAAL
ncbi:hypothetical protein BDF20DRAFT_836151 [Mycotypha africana]|uniref:uncharacterized protein n=1 Tax=Mycotypha africana TaxID=64632 RepID=UPI0023002472|nr:uncharacterized protein BDF20DRAFT_836151 [Mycotypha africana]KAI8977337.1 hypothetical protein BDF20DRAFT_836151 [Mycotypha africana]